MTTDGQKEAIKTYVEQTKLLVTLASAFLVAPAGLVAFLKDSQAIKVDQGYFGWFIGAEISFIVSVLASYVVLGSITGSLAQDNFDVYRCATRVSALIQFGSYLIGMVLFMTLAAKII
jgi:hypothetical protein